ncbi:MAG: hypothetical protein A2177_15650 [Spirochaetes bacterium RBG_13_68_11]|nr:MAG: hypothetical protein A2177_15650 [Spirochaetes bacterium RBG_13_68_11]
MKQTVQMQKAQERMAPGVITRDGLLGSDRRPLGDILLADDAAVKALDLDHQAVAARMIELRDAGMAGLGEFIDVAPHYEVRVDTVRGKLPCPFADPGMFPKTNVTVRNRRTGREITFTDLNIHLVQAHGFYEGKGCAFRLEPKDLAEVLEIA